MGIKITDLPAEVAPSGDDLIVIRDNASGTTRKIPIQTLLLAFSNLYSPTGAVTQYAGTTAPDGWLICDGSPVDRTTYADLFAIVGTTYGPGNGVDTFNLPDMRGLTPVGLASSGTFNLLGKTGGTETETLTVAQMPSHAHSVNDPGHAHGVYDPGHSHALRGMNNPNGDGSGVEWTVTYETRGGGVAPSGTGIGIYGSGTGVSIFATGGNQAHNNLPPYRVLNFIVKY